MTEYITEGMQKINKNATVPLRMNEAFFKRKTEAY